MKYAADTSVSSEKSRAEIERTLIRYGCQGFAYGWDGKGNRAMISFEMNGRGYRIAVPLPAKDAREFTHTAERGKPRTPQAAEAAWEQGTRQRYRALALAVKAVLEAAESGIWTIERVLESFMLLPNGQTVGDWVQPQIERAYLTGEMPALLPLLEYKL